MKTQSQVIIGRVRFIFFLIFIFSIGLIYRLYMIQIVSSDDFSNRADRQYVAQSPALLNRGTIFFTNKDGNHITAGYQHIGSLITLNPTVLTDPESVFVKISNVLEINKEKFMEKAMKRNDTYEEIAKRVDTDIGKRISELKIDGVFVYKQKWRAYPFDNLASGVLGFMAFDGDELAGRYGLEKQYESVLSRSNDATYYNFFVEMFSNIKHVFSEDSIAEGDIVTTIEPAVQEYLEQSLEIVTDKWRSSYSAGIVMNPSTGEIIAMASYPTFNPNNFNIEKNPKIFSNKLVEDVYEMGSIIKPLTVAAGIDAGVITAKTTYNDLGFLVLNNSRISNYDGRGRGTVDMQQVLNQSLNTGVAYIVTRLNNANFSKYMKSFGLDKKTGIDLPYEAAPLVENLNSPRDIEHATASYGQGIAMSPVATVRALSILANGGRLVNPHIVSRINYKSGLSKKTAVGVGEQVIKPETAEEVTRMLVEVVDNALLGGSVKLEHYSVAAKTGTAQIPQVDGRGYYEDRYLHSFFGYFPAYKPQFIIFLYTYYPKEVRYASETLTHSFIDMTKYLINYYDIPPDR